MFLACWEPTTDRAPEPRARLPVREHDKNDLKVFFFIQHTVDGQNPAPPRMIIIPLFIGF